LYRNPGSLLNQDVYGNIRHKDHPAYNLQNELSNKIYKSYIDKRIEDYYYVVVELLGSPQPCL